MVIRYEVASPIQTSPIYIPEYHKYGWLEKISHAALVLVGLVVCFGCWALLVSFLFLMFPTAY